jgi:hypothetical protein
MLTVILLIISTVDAENVIKFMHIAFEILSIRFELYISVSSTFLPPFLLSTIVFEVIQAELLTASLNKRQIKKERKK